LRKKAKSERFLNTCSEILFVFLGWWIILRAFFSLISIIVCTVSVLMWLVLYWVLKLAGGVTALQLIAFWMRRGYENDRNWIFQRQYSSGLCTDKLRETRK
jgi:hypothetical protein